MSCCILCQSYCKCHKKTWMRINRVYGQVLSGNPIFCFIKAIHVCQWATVVHFITIHRCTVMYFKPVSHKCHKYIPMHIYPKATMVPAINALHPKLYVTYFMQICIFSGLETWCWAYNTFRSINLCQIMHETPYHYIKWVQYQIFAFFRILYYRCRAM